MGALDAFFGFAEGGRTGEVYLFSAWPPPDLAPFGWEQAGTPPLLRLPPGVALPPAPPELRVERVRDAAGARAWEAVAVRGYPFAECEPVAPGALVDERVLRDPRLRLWVGWVGDLPVCASAAFVAAGLSAVTMVVTVPAMRGRGYGAAISATAAESEPGLPALLTASDLGAPGYERLGFRRVGRFSVWSRFRP
jgi:GNAT superfamily N-acetyltransferase